MRRSSKVIAAAAVCAALFTAGTVAAVRLRKPTEVSPGTTSISALGKALGCDSVRGGRYEVGLFYEQRKSLEIETGRNCYEDGRFFARIHVFKVAAPEVIDEHLLRFLLPAAAHQPSCQSEPFAVVAGRRWAVVTRESAAATVLHRVGGDLIPVPGNGTTVASYDLPCVGDAEPP